jgi:hypothetical protein
MWFTPGYAYIPGSLPISSRGSYYIRFENLAKDSEYDAAGDERRDYAFAEIIGPFKTLYDGSDLPYGDETTPIPSTNFGSSVNFVSVNAAFPVIKSFGYAGVLRNARRPLEYAPTAVGVKDSYRSGILPADSSQRMFKYAGIVSPGLSGGPVFSASGSVIAINREERSDGTVVLAKPLDRRALDLYLAVQNKVGK